MTKKTDSRIKLLLAGIMLVALGTLALCTWYALSHNPNVLDTAGIVGDQEKQLIIFALGLSLIVVIPVYVMLGVITWKFRATNKKAKYQPNWDSSKAIETAWWLIPTALIMVLSVVAWKSSHQLDPFRPLESSVKPVEIQVVALQWKWLFIYPEENIASVNYLEVPTNTPINFKITADSPMNSFWIPKLGGQVYAMSGMSTQLHLMANEQGRFVGSSANISGEGFAGMKFEVKATSQADYNQWIAAVKQTPQSLNTPTYQALAQPSQNVKPVYYGDVQSNLYDTIVMKYMQPSTDPSKKNTYDQESHNDASLEMSHDAAHGGH